MMTLTTILLLILVGLVLIVVEIIFVPGTTLVGILGVIFAGLGVFLGFLTYGSEVGTWMLAGTAAIAGGTLYWSIRHRSWDHFSLDKSIDSRVNEDEMLVPVGTRGVTTSKLRPSGNADFNGQVFEVRTNGYQLEEGVAVRVSKVEGKTIYVEPLTIYQ